MDGAVTRDKRYSILVIAPTSFFSDYGCSVRILEEIRALHRAGHRVTVCTYRNGQDLPDVTIRRTPTIPFRNSYEVGSSLHKVAFDFLLFWVVLFSALRHRPDVIHGHMHEGALIGRIVGWLLHIPMVFDFQGSLTSEMVDHRFLRPNGLFYRPLRWLEGVVDRQSPVILTSSENARQLLIGTYHCRPERVQALPDCVDAHCFYPAGEGEHEALARMRAALAIPPGRRIVVYLGLLAAYQGTDALLQAIARLLQRRGDVHFLIMGFPAVERYQSMAVDLGIAGHTTLTGKIKYGQARSYLALGDAAVAPKLSATEGNGKILNYMAMGLPTVAFKTPVSQEYLGELGIYATPGDPGSLAEALLLSLSDPLNHERRIRLRQVAEDRFSWDFAVERIVAAYGLACRQHQAPTRGAPTDGS